MKKTYGVFDVCLAGHRTSSKDRAPLVLAITGPTGTGKTEMSNLIAEALFQRKKKLPHSEKRVPSGLLIYR